MDGKLGAYFGWLPRSRFTIIPVPADMAPFYTSARGGKTAYLKEQAQALGISLATLHRKMEAVVLKPSRKRRADAGKSALTR